MRYANTAYLPSQLLSPAYGAPQLQARHLCTIFHPYRIRS